MRWELFHRFAHRVLVETRLGDLWFGMAFLRQASSRRNQIRHVGSEDLRWFLWVQRKPPQARRDKPTMTGLIRRLGCVPGEMPTARQNNEQIKMAGLGMSFESPEVFPSFGREKAARGKKRSVQLLRRQTNLGHFAACGLTKLNYV